MYFVIYSFYLWRQTIANELQKENIHTHNLHEQLNVRPHGLWPWTQSWDHWLDTWNFYVEIVVTGLWLEHVPTSRGKLVNYSLRISHLIKKLTSNILYGAKCWSQHPFVLIPMSCLMYVVPLKAASPNFFNFENWSLCLKCTITYLGTRWLIYTRHCHIKNMYLIWF